MSELTKEVNVYGNKAYLKAAANKSVLNLFGIDFTAEYLRELADEVDRMEKAADVYFDCTEYTINYMLGGHEDCEIIKGENARAAVFAFKRKFNYDTIQSVYDRDALKDVDESEYN